MDLVISGDKKEAVSKIDKEVDDAQLNAALKQVVEAVLKLSGSDQVNFSVKSIFGPAQALEAETKRSAKALREAAKQAKDDSGE